MEVKGRGEWEGMNGYASDLLYSGWLEELELSLALQFWQNAVNRCTHFALTNSAPYTSYIILFSSSSVEIFCTPILSACK